MKNTWILTSLMSTAVALLILGGYAKPQNAQRVGAQEEHKTYQLAAGAHLDVSRISGPVSVEAVDGSVAEVSIYRTAPNPDNLVYRKVSVDQTSSGLTIQQKPVSGEPDAVDLLNRVVLKVPRQVSVTGKSISGDFNVSGIDGPVDLNSISGSVAVKHFSGAVSISGASGNVSVFAERINEGGVRVTNVSGTVYLRLAGDLNADLSVGNTTGGVSNKMEGLTLNEAGGSSYSGRLGSGGPRIEVSNVTGKIVLQRMNQERAEIDRRDQIDRSFTLPAKALVKVSRISGSVDITAIDGDTAMVHIERKARSRAELDCDKVVLQEQSGNLLVKSETTGCQVVQLSYVVRLSVPRTADVSVDAVSGPINIGEIDGALRLSGNSGEINLAQAGSRSIISGNSGTTKIKLRQLDAGGLRLSGNSGTIHLYIAGDLNADVRVSGIDGSVSSELPSVKFDKTGAADYHARIGSGGATINVEGCAGNVLLSRYPE